MQDSDNDSRGVDTCDVEHLKGKGPKKKKNYIYIIETVECVLWYNPPAENKLIPRFFSQSFQAGRRKEERERETKRV
jgi:hypothetical protein